jgi:hypothetical protein
MTMKRPVRHAVALLAVMALVAAGGCGKSESGKAEGKATSTPSGKQSQPNGY